VARPTATWAVSSTWRRILRRQRTISPRSRIEALTLSDRELCRRKRSALHAQAPQSCGYRLEALSQSDVPSTTFDVDRRFVVIVLKITNDERSMSECWHRNAPLPRRRLRPNYRRCGSRYEMAPIPCAFRPLRYYLLGMPA
jgi:hypothetical protein